MNSRNGQDELEKSRDLFENVWTRKVAPKFVVTQINDWRIVVVFQIVEQRMEKWVNMWINVSNDQEMKSLETFSNFSNF